MEGIPEITASITSSWLDFLVVHPCVLEGDTHVQPPMFQPSQMFKGSELVARKLRFRPLTESFPLCHYSAKTPHGLPIQGIYQMQVKGFQTKIEANSINETLCLYCFHCLHLHVLSQFFFISRVMQILCRCLCS